jgi:hypothetical protein
MSVDVYSKFGFVGDGVKDNSAALAAWVNDIQNIANSNAPLPRYEFHEGIIAYEQWPTWTVPSDLEVVGTGQCVLKCMGPGDAVTLQGSTADLTWRARFDNFIIVPMHGRGLVTWHMHSSRIRVSVPGTAGQNAVHVYFSVLSEFEIGVIPQQFGKWSALGKPLNGLVLDSTVPGGPLQTSKCAIKNPNLAGCSNAGLLIANAGMNDIWGGALEGNGVGLQIQTGGHNNAHATDFESNTTADVQWPYPGAHDNYLLYCTLQKRPAFSLTNHYIPTLADDIGL